MKKIILCLSTLLLIFGAVPAQALMGVPDDVPGRDILVPFFFVSMGGFGNENTVISITETKGIPTNLLYVVFDKDGAFRFDNDLSLTPYDVLTIDARTIVDAMSDAGRAAIEMDVDADGVMDHWVGYICFYNTSTNTNNLISHVYQVDLPAGRAVSYNPPRLEYSPGVADSRQVADTVPFYGAEAYSANALWVGKNLLAGNYVPVSDASFFRLILRYFILNKMSKNLFIIWVDPAVDPPGTVVCYIFDEDENGMSMTIPINHGLNILDIGMYIPVSWLQSYPVGGWLDIDTSAGNGFDANRSWLGYSWQLSTTKVFKGKGKPAFFPGPIRWDVIQAADRETDDVSYLQ